MKASPKINPHELIESARDLSNTTAMQGEKIELEKTLNSTSTAEETDRSISELRSTKSSVKKLFSVKMRSKQTLPLGSSRMR